MIKQWEEFEKLYQDLVDDHFIPLFCEKHEDQGYTLFKKGGSKELVPKFYENRLKAGNVQKKKRSKSDDRKKQIKKSSAQKSKDTLIALDGDHNSDTLKKILDDIKNPEKKVAEKKPGPAYKKIL